MSDSLYEVGDWIVHNHYGVGEIRGIDVRRLNGVEKKYLRVKTLDGEYWLPTENTDVDYIRPISSGSTFRKVLSTIRKLPQPLPDDHKVRAKEISRMLENGALVRMARLIRDLYGRGYKVKLNMSEEDTMLRIRKRFIDEWVVAAGIEKAQAEAKLDRALQESVQKIEED